MYDADIEKALVGKKITNIFMNEEALGFRDSDGGEYWFSVEGDCCSHSVFYDFYGVKNLLENGPITEVKEVELHPNLSKDNKNYQEEIKVYGFQLTTESEEFGPVTSVFSFRNYSNGYYGGWLRHGASKTVNVPEITDDVIETQSMD